MPVSSAEARTKVFECWGQLERLSGRSFPGESSLSEEGLTYVLEKLGTDNWRPVRTWDEERPFLPFLLTLASRALTDFRRHNFGYHRRPAWLQACDDPLLDKAYRLLQVERYGRQEAVEMLLTLEPYRERWFLEEVVASVLAKCRQQPVAITRDQTIEDYPNLSTEERTPEETLLIEEEEALIDILRYYLEGRDRAEMHPRVRALLQRLDVYIQLSEEDQLLLRLRYLKGIKVHTIVAMLGLKGDVYKRLRKILKQLRSGFRQAVAVGQADSIQSR